MAQAPATSGCQCARDGPTAAAPSIGIGCTLHSIAKKVPSRRHFFSISKSEVPNTQEQLFVVWPHPTPQHDSHRVFFFHTGGPYFLHQTSTANPHTPKTIMRRSALSRATSVLLALLSTATGRQLYPVKAALQTGRLPVSDTHTLY